MLDSGEGGEEKGMVDGRGREGERAKERGREGRVVGVEGGVRLEGVG